MLQQDGIFNFDGFTAAEQNKLNRLVELVKSTDFTPITDAEFKTIKPHQEAAYHNNRLEGLFLSAFSLKINEIFDYFKVPFNLRNNLDNQLYKEGS